MSPTHRDSGDPVLDEASCERLLAEVRSTADPAWRALMSLLWPKIAWLARTSRAMRVLAGSDDHVRNATLLVFEKLGREGCRAARLYAPWRVARPDKTLHDWLRIVTTNVARDYVRERAGRAERGAVLDKRLLSSLATLLPDDDDLPVAPALSMTSGHAAREIVRWAERHLPADQLAALGAWLEGESFEAIATGLAVPDARGAKRLVRAAVAALRRQVSAA